MKRAHFMKITIIDHGKKVINLTLPTFLISIPLFFIPNRLLKKWAKEDMDLKGLIKALIKEGKGSRINVIDNDSRVYIELK